jgi:hypothetical protein
MHHSGELQAYTGLGSAKSVIFFSPFYLPN